ncbi:NAD(P)/FAD-dependent oxidoreductase [Luteolibacter yonseiensis]|uniref:NAD(P)/FAD-dependent oxidoreductase n=1 Tax=Luteolibacter yonseiensis TaxID=1144680 RepID=A0A934V8U8_9BACT|nr:NAD(P)/FAD-dependent oxidoreductase [Luteolibacter yonseiensis]MBK1814493.1 NAD(P)/FAD-dependent oxidoreductase [Luteolibacter yonseiensis]
MNTEDFPESASYDVVVIGGALSGAATATLLMRQNPGIRVLIVEKTERLSRRVGEATVEISGYFMCRVLGMTSYLNEKHLVKQGLRFWFRNDDVKSLGEASELGAKYLSRIPSFQLDRAAFDEEVLRRAGEAGAMILRPATVSKIQLNPGGDQTMEIRHGDKRQTATARWIVDASGLAAMLARKEGWWKSNTEHPTAAAWSRWTGVKDWDSRELALKFPEWSKAVYGTRNTATNHVIGDGWWSWWIPLKGGDVSVGVVFDQRLVDFPKDGGSIGERVKAFLMEHPVGREMIQDATYHEDDQLWRKNLAYYSTTFAGDGFVLVGDAAAFMDPFYSPGMDWISFTTSSAANLITQQRKGLNTPATYEKYNRDFAISHRRWFTSLYKDKYEYMGEYDLMSLAFQMDLGLYYWGVVEVPFNMGETALHFPPFSPPSGKLFAALMGTYNRRFAQIARRRRKEGRLGKSNRLNRCLIPGFKLNRGNMLTFFPMLAKWMALELREGWRSWGDPTETPERETPAAEVAAE